jgi:hypothetical protein
MLNWTRRLSCGSALAGVVLIPIVAQNQAPSAGNVALIVFLIAIGLTLLFAVGLAVLMWVLSLRSPYAAVGTEPKAAPKKREELPPGVHLPAPSIQPLILAIGMTIMVFGLVFRGFAIQLAADFNIPVIMVLGLIITLAGFIGWVREGHRAAQH